LIKQYSEAENKIISGRAGISNAYFQAQLSIFQGILYEKKYHDLKKAQAYYLKGIRDIAPFKAFGQEYKAYAYFGLSRISEINGDNHARKTYRKQALDLASYKEVNFDD
jgi:hypothetical protein